MESPRCGSLRPIFLEFEGFEVDHLHVVDQNKDTSSSELFEAVDSLLGDIEALAGSLSAIPSPGQGNPEAGVEVALRHLGDLEEKWSGRGTVINEIVKTSS